MPLKLELSAALGFCILAAAFVLCSRLSVFNTIGVMTLAGAGATLWAAVRERDATGAEAAVAAAGLCLCWLGLLMVRMMLRRSVSLRLLRRAVDGEDATDAGEAFLSRLDEARRHHLVTDDDGRYRLTQLGRWLAGLTAALYRVTGNRS